MQNSLIDYYRTQQTAHQWVDFLSALADELSSQATDDELRSIFFAVGKRQALLLQNYLEDVRTLHQLEEALNDYWSRQHWGFVRFEEDRDHVRIHHAASPLSYAFGAEAMPWATGFLEGFYEQVFKVMGAGGGMHVVALSGEEDGLNLFFRFGEA